MKIRDGNECIQMFNGYVLSRISNNKKTSYKCFKNVLKNVFLKDKSLLWNFSGKTYFKFQMKDMQMQLDYKDFKKCIFRINMRRRKCKKERS